MTTSEGVHVDELKVLPKRVGGNLDLAIYLGKDEPLAARLVAVRFPLTLRVNGASISVKLPNANSNLLVNVP
jgi:hypothetical protein